jgi:hypothetical protein
VRISGGKGVIRSRSVIGDVGAESACASMGSSLCFGEKISGFEWTKGSPSAGAGFFQGFLGVRDM